MSTKRRVNTELLDAEHPTDVFIVSYCDYENQQTVYPVHFTTFAKAEEFAQKLSEITKDAYSINRLVQIDNIDELFLAPPISEQE